MDLKSAKTFLEMAPDEFVNLGLSEVVVKAHARATIARCERESLLLEADIEINKLEDVGSSSLEWRAYRQALRDVPQQAGFPASINWPTAPGTQE